MMSLSKKFKDFILDFIKRNIAMFFVAGVTFLISSIINIFPAKIYQTIVDYGFIKKNFTVVSTLSIILMITYLFKVVMNYISNHKLLIMGNKITSELKDMIFDRLFSLELNFLSDYDTGYISSRVEEVSKIDNIFSNVSIFLGDKNILENFNLSIIKGDKIQINDDNGTGKTTLIKILLKNYRPNSGDIYINGINYDSINKNSILDKISYVPQKQFVFNETALKNITLGMDNYDKDLLEKLIKEFSLEKVINYSDGSKIRNVGEAGEKLSGGEMQKILICRAILRDKEILIFDEATNNLDDKSIKYLKEYIMNSEKTWIIIDHQNDFRNLGFRQINMNRK